MDYQCPSPYPVTRAYILLFIYIFLLLLYLVYSSYSYVPQLSVISTHRLRVSTHIPILSIYLFTLLQLYLLIYNRFVLPDNTVISTHRLRLYLLIYNTNSKIMNERVMEKEKVVI